MKHEKILNLKKGLNEAREKISKIADYSRSDLANNSEELGLLRHLTSRMEQVSGKIFIHLLARENSNNFLDDFLTNREMKNFIDISQKLETGLDSFFKANEDQLRGPEITKLLKNLDSKIGPSFKRYGSI